MAEPRWFETQARRSAELIGSPRACVGATAACLLWFLTGPLFDWSDTWQLVINTSTTVVTFLMLFVLQGSQNRDTHAMQSKLDEVIRSIPAANNAMRGIEHKGESGGDQPER